MELMLRLHIIRIPTRFKPKKKYDIEALFCKASFRF